jgi:ribose transport system permease protein
MARLMSEVTTAAAATRGIGERAKGWFSPRRIGAIYVWIAFIILFTILSPGQFPEYATVKQILNEYSVTLLVALGLLMPLAAGLYDLSVGSVMGMCGIGSAWFLAHVTPNPWLALVAGLAIGLACGLLNVLVVIVMRVDSFIGTLATSSIYTALVIAVSGSNTITQNVGGTFQVDFALKNVDGLTAPVGLMVAGVLGLAFALEKTAFGRRVYATGFDVEVARLGGVNVGRLRAVTLLVSASFAALAGVLQTAALGAGDPTVGPDYLLPAFAAAFLGATQFRAGRVNPWGTAVAGLLLGTADVGLLLAGAPQWAPSIFSGALLILAVSLTRANIRDRLRQLLQIGSRRRGGSLDRAERTPQGSLQGG